MLIYHHCIDLEKVVYGKIKGNPNFSDDIYIGAYRWLEKQVGFFPLFLAVGETEDDISMTGYNNQWSRIIGSEIVGRKKDGAYIQKFKLRKKGEFPNYVLFSYEDVDGIFLDFWNWCSVLNAEHKDYQMSDHEKTLIFKQSWNKSQWLRKAKDESHSVQLVSPELDLTGSNRIWVRNKDTERYLRIKGFDNVEVRKLSGRLFS